MNLIFCLPQNHHPPLIRRKTAITKKLQQQISEWLRTLDYRWNTLMKISSQKTLLLLRLNVGFVGVGGGGNKMANAFIELGFNKTLLVNTTGKDIPKNVEEDHVVLIPDSDGIGKNTEYGKEVLSQNGAVVEDALRIKLGKVDWLVCFSWRWWWNWKFCYCASTCV